MIPNPEVEILQYDVIVNLVKPIWCHLVRMIHVTTGSSISCSILLNGCLLAMSFQALSPFLAMTVIPVIICSMQHHLHGQNLQSGWKRSVAQASQCRRRTGRPMRCGILDSLVSLGQMGVPQMMMPGIRGHASQA